MLIELSQFKNSKKVDIYGKFIDKVIYTPSFNKVYYNTEDDTIHGIPINSIESINDVPIKEVMKNIINELDIVKVNLSVKLTLNKLKKFIEEFNTDYMFMNEVFIQLKNNTYRKNNVMYMYIENDELLIKTHENHCHQPFGHIDNIKSIKVYLLKYNHDTYSKESHLSQEYAI